MPNVCPAEKTPSADRSADVSKDIKGRMPETRRDNDFPKRRRYIHHLVGDYFFSSTLKYSAPDRCPLYTLSTLSLTLGFLDLDSNNRLSVMVISLPFLAFWKNGRRSTGS